MKISLIGFGNLGQALTQVFLEKKESLQKNSGFSPKIVAAVDVGGGAIAEDGLDMEKLLDTMEESETIAEYPEKGDRDVSALDAIENVDSDLVVELTPTSIEDGDPGLTHIKKAMNRGRHVVTSNKGPLVVSFQELDQLSEKTGVEFRYSATVGGAVPVLGLAKRQLSGDRVSEIKGVLNGTTNYILSRMAEEGTPFDVVLHEAQELGVAESDPTLDIEGIDTAAKITILANALLERNVSLDDVDVEGITRIGPDVVKFAQESGNVVRLVGIANGDTLEVGPKLVSSNDPLAVKGTLNSVTLETDLAREVTITGFGAGPRETSSALLSDIVDVYKSIED